MNVLTFGDKPAPAMAQVALRKTAEEENRRVREQHKLSGTIHTWMTSSIQFPRAKKPES